MRSLLVLVGSGLLLCSNAHAFVLLSGPDEATLRASIDAPIVRFAVSAKTPPISGKGKFLGGKYADLDDRAFWLALIQETMAPWNNVSSAFIQMEIDPDADDAVADKEDEIHSIVVDSVNLSAAAFARPNIEDGHIIDCDITISTKRKDAESLASTMMHELGHCLGLGHNHTNYDSVMGYSREDNKLRLGLDDKAGVTYLYPGENVGDPKETLGCAVVGDGHSQKILALLCALFPLAAVGIFRWSVSRKRQDGR